MPGKTDKALTDLHRLIASKNFSSEEELRQFLDTIVGKSLDELPHTELSPAQRAEDMVFDAAEMPPPFARIKLEQALEEDPDCIAAYEALGNLEPSPAIANAFFEKGIALGRQRFGGEYVEKNKGHFWGLHETRPFMRCVANSADCLYLIGRKREAMELYRELLELNPNDNQGIRDLMMLYLIEAGDFEGYRQYATRYKEDDMAFARFNKALAAFKEEGPTERAATLLREASKGNRYVYRRLRAKKPVNGLPESYSVGSADEAEMYAYYAWEIWQETPGAVDWMEGVMGKGAKGKK